MADVNIQLGYKNAAWFTANAAIILDAGQIVYLEQTGTYKLGDGVTVLSALSFLGANGSVAHNDTTGKQGGTTNEYYHLTSAEHTIVQNTSNTNTGDETASRIGSLLTDESVILDSDSVVSWDGTFLLKTTWLNIKAFLKTYFDGIYSTTKSMIQITSAGFNPADNSYYYFRINAGTPISSGVAIVPAVRFKAVANTTSFRVDGYISNTTAGSSEAITMKLFNNTLGTNITITSTLTADAVFNSFTFTGDFTINTGNEYYIEMLTPTWPTTNPTGFIPQLNLMLK